MSNDQMMFRSWLLSQARESVAAARANRIEGPAPWRKQGYVDRWTHLLLNRAAADRRQAMAMK